MTPNIQYFGKDLTAYLKAIRNDKDAVYVPGKNVLSIVVKEIAVVKVPAKDCNRSTGASANANAATRVVPQSSPADRVFVSMKCWMLALGG